ncbi:LOW QUALITY PROTEIN: uncharacterized protein PAF06_009311 [Gastrophryne carolinensis]
MASADVRRDLLDCSICLNIYTDPVILRCGHNFCRDCIDNVLDSQVGSGVYSCPECRAGSVERPVLVRNITLCNIVEAFPSTPPEPESGIFCTYCVDGSPVPAIKSCLHCEASLCDKHLRVHSKSPEHVLTDPTASMQNKKCSIHKRILEYYCPEDSACICVSCRLDGDHRGHQVEMLEEASEKRKEELRNNLKELITEREETEKKIQSLQENMRGALIKSSGLKGKVTTLVGDLRRQLGDLEKRVLQEEQKSLSLSDSIHQLEQKKDILTRKMHHNEELCIMADPLTLLQESGDKSGICDIEVREKQNQEIHKGEVLDVPNISQTLERIVDIITEIKRGIYMEGPADILLDVNTAHNNLHISDDRKTVTWMKTKQSRPKTPERFQNIYNLLSSGSFASGQHYWEVECSEEAWWRIGMCFPSIEREGDLSRIGDNDKSWCLLRKKNQLEVRHGSKKIQLQHSISSNKFRVCLDYEAGQLSFYELCDPIQHLHTFTTSFTEPLHVALCVFRRKEEMASTDLRNKLLDCSICLKVFTDPVILKCGHNFCRDCIDRALDTQEGFGVYSCPECRAGSVKRPALVRNITLRNIVETFQSTPPYTESGLFCTYCVDGSPVPAVKSCLHCEASLCDKHLTVHSKSPEHVLTDPTAPMQNKKCSIHKRILEYYCPKDDACICVSCSVAGEHRGHKVEMLVEASENKKEELKNNLKKLITEREENEKRIQSLREHMEKTLKEPALMKERATTLIGGLRRQLDDLEKRVLCDISRQEGQMSRTLSGAIHQLEKKEEALSRKMHHTEELCNMTDPLTLLQASDMSDCDSVKEDDENAKTLENQPQVGADLDVTVLSQTLGTLSKTVSELKRGIYKVNPADIVLDVNTAHNNLHISEDRKTVTYTLLYLNRPQSPERFQTCKMVLSSGRFSSGRHYWDVKYKGTWWEIGMCYPSMERKGELMAFGKNDKSWCLWRIGDFYLVRHNKEKIQLPHKVSSRTVRVSLDYEAGQLSFQELCDPIKHLHTFTTIFREPLHAALLMASADVRKDLLDCSICLNIYTDPVTLGCGHNFCRDCIDHVLNTQEGSGVYSCPECRAGSVKRPVLVRNITLCNIVEAFPSTPPDPESGIFCTYCINGFPVPAVKSCLLCEASLCDKHLRVHSKSPEHILTDPIVSMENKKCSIHKRILEYYCPEDAACICVSCRLDGDHRGHQVEMLEEASEKRKGKLRNNLKKLITEREVIEKKIQSLQEKKKRRLKESSFLKGTIANLVGDLAIQVNDLKKRVLCDISRQEGQMSLSLSDSIHQLERKKDALSRKMRHIEELCTTTDPLTLLQASDPGDSGDTVEGENRVVRGWEKNPCDGGDLDVTVISHTLVKITNIINKIKRGIYREEEMLLDVNTAHKKLCISADGKTATWAKTKQNYPESSERFQTCFSVLSRGIFSSGQYSWEAESSKAACWEIGMCYPSIHREGHQSSFGDNDKSWCLVRDDNQYHVRHNNREIQLPHNVSSNRVRVSLDYEGGQLSFYELCHPIQHLHTFTTSFTEPLHAALSVYQGKIRANDIWVKILN